MVERYRKSALTCRTVTPQGKLRISLIDEFIKMPVNAVHALIVDESGAEVFACGRNDKGILP
jgi:hypothetical protein